MSVGTTTPLPLGTFVGGPASGDPAAEAAVETQYAGFVRDVGAAPQFMDAFVDQTQPITSWAANASYTAYSWRQSPIAQSVIPVIGLPMATTADTGNQDAVFRAFSAGTYDSVLRGIVTAWAQQGYTSLYIRPGYEGNGTFVPWYAGSDPQTRADWVAAFQHIASVVRDVPGSTVKVVWNPNIQAGNTADVTGLYPGDSSVDVIAGDIYSPMYPRSLYDWALNNGTYDATFAQWAANPINRIHYWTYPAANQWNQISDGQSYTFSLQNMIDFARAHGKPIAIAETGAGGDGTHGPTDDPAFPQWLATTLENANLPVSFVNIWDTNPGNGNWDFSSTTDPKPLEAAAWAQYFGPYVPAITVGAGPDSIVLDVSEDAYLGNAQFTVSVDGTQVGGTLTALASHAAGQSQAVTIEGSFGPGAHLLTVSFLNDAWGGKPSLDRNLYVDSTQVGGSTIQRGSELPTDGSQTFGVGTPVPVGTGTDILTLQLSEDAWRGDAQFIVSIDGHRLAGPQAVSAIHGQGSETFTFLGSFGAGPHTVGVTFLNDAYGGSAAADRNLYVDGVALDGMVPGVDHASLFNDGTANFVIPAAPASAIHATHMMVASSPDIPGHMDQVGMVPMGH